MITVTDISFWQSFAEYHTHKHVCPFSNRHTLCYPRRNSDDVP